MVDFGNTQFEGSITPEIVRQAPVVDESLAVLGEALQRPAQQIGGIVGSVFKAQADAENNSVLSGFRSKLLSLADAAEQNNWSAGEIGIRQRALYNEYNANAPALGDDLNKIYTDMTGGRIASVLNSASETAQAQAKVVEAAITNGWVADPNNPQQGMQNYMRSQAAANQLALATNLRNVTEFERSTAITNGLRQVADTSLPWVQDRVGVALQEIKNGGDPAEVYAKLQSDYAAQKAAISGIAQEVNADWVMSPMDTIIADFGKVVNGEYTTEAYNAQVASQVAKGKSAWMADPELGQILVAQEVLGENFPTLMQQMLPRAQKKLAEFLTPYDAASDSNTPPPDIFDVSEATQQNFDLLRDELKVVNAGGATEAGANQTANKVVNLLRSFKNYSGAVENPRQLRQAMDLLASEEFNAWTVANKGVPTELVDAAKNLIQAQYEGPLLEAVRSRWDGLDISITGAGATAQNPYGFINSGAANYIDTIWDGTGVRFVAKPGFEDNIIVRSAIQGLNSGDNSVAQPINTLIRATATVEGTNDFKSIWEGDLKERIFPTTPVDQTGTPVVDLEPFTPEAQSAVVGSKGLWYTSPDAADSDTNVAYTQNTEALASVPNPSSISLADFNDDLNLVKEVVEASYAAEPTKMMQSTDPITIASSYLGLKENNNEQNVVLSSFIKQSAGINIDPAKTAWCAAFLDAVLHRAGMGGGTGKLNARSYLNWGSPVEVPQVGDVVVLSRGPVSGWQGHVGLFMGYESDGKIKILGGNQSNSVSVSSYKAETLLGFRRAGM